MLSNSSEVRNMTTQKIERLGTFLRQHPYIGIPVKLFFTVVLGVGLLGITLNNKVLPKFLIVLGHALVWLSFVLLVFWILGRGVSIGDVLITYAIGQGLRFSVWLSSLLKRLPS
ncbi:MAG: hypothetical protein A3A27_02050 [Candidatus Wildermuthbacteria bacterium RIFCSPLOWO2_01_FULL_47_18]|uniref:Uncharacterized protein n=2 Tax=Candidatus Wildermuthiibacteriota TaxID=1817923 RepID=A0A1G2RFJ9_9BACT|nr:MAG: hypothetical protein A3J68_01335 [Candidatus Wildermuthbacteria bacterium RIFCSPHIGHO2_02_FULL_48_16]OHA71615.1 MAG: hypothetical protein A3A27_02050 [Candidatus Wildermuthbacteria bacterium RIFCSPLOWO2_01_FULL_47_18]